MCPKPRPYLPPTPIKVPSRRNFLSGNALRFVRMAPQGTRLAEKAFSLKELTNGDSMDSTMKDPKPLSPRSAPKGGLNSEIQARIGHQLRAMYDDVVKQGVPDRFAELIRKLDAGEGPPADMEGLPQNSAGRE